MTTYLFLGVGIWTLYYAWQGSVPDAWDPLEKQKGQRMRPGQRFIFGLGGALVTALGLVLLFR